MARPKDEPLGKTLSRMARSAAPPPARKGGKAAQQKNKGDATATATAAAAAVAEPERQRGETTTAEELIAATALFPPSSSSSSSSSPPPHDTTPPPIPGETPNGEAWPLAAGGTLRVGEGSLFAVVVNPPTVVRASLAAAAPLRGLPVAPAVDALFADRDAARYAWFRRRRLGEGGATDVHAWEEIRGENRAAFVPREEDVGCFLRVVVTPARREACSSSSSSDSDSASLVLGAPVSAESSVPVAEGPALPPWHGRVKEEDENEAAKGPNNGDAFSVPRFRANSNRLRVVTYNLLADQYAASDYAKTHLFSHCHPRYLEADYRRSLAAAEVARYGADVVCLQEVDERCFSDVLAPLLGAEGYEGRFTGKASTVREGSATFWRAERFEVAAERDVVLKEVFGRLWEGRREGGVGGGGGGGGEEEGAAAAKSGGNAPDADADADDPLSASAVAARHAPLLPALRSSAWLRESLSKVSTVAQVTLLVPRRRRDKRGGEEEEDNAELDGSGPLLVTNTHLFFHPSAPHVRTLHVQAMLTEAADVAQRAADTEKLRGEEKPAAIFCGDLNSDLNDGVPGVVELLREGSLPGGYWDWALGASFRYDDDGVGPPVSDAEKRVEKEREEDDDEGRTKKKPYGSDGTPLPKPVSPPSGDAAGGDGLCPPDLRLPFDFFPADSLQTPCTNYVRGYSGLLDFVWADRGALKRAEAGSKSDDGEEDNDDEENAFLSPPPPPVSSLGGFIPNERFPSDHLAVVADLEWLPRGEQRQASRPPPDATAAGRGPAAPWPPPLPPQTLRLPEVRLRDEKNNAAVAPDAPTSAAALMVLSGRGQTISAADPTALPACVLALRAGEILAVPTDTLYGVAACACSPSAVARVYSAKGRGSSAPLAVCVAEAADVAGVADVSGLPAGLLEAMLPGPVTLLLRRRRKEEEEEEEEQEGEKNGGSGTRRTRRLPSRLCAALNPGTPTVGVRVPDSQFIRALARAHGGPIALTSANESGRPPALEAAECYEGSGGREGSGGAGRGGIAGECAAVVDGGRVPASGREGSTIVDLSSVDFDEKEEGESEPSRRSFSIVREGQAGAKVREMLVGRFGLVEMV